jgi:NADH:ubiquinone oxidoreductase subunit K
MSLPSDVALVSGLALVVVGVAVATLILRRSLIASAVAVGLMMQGLAWGAAAGGQEALAGVLVAVGVTVVAALAAAAIAVHRRRGTDHVDELRELQG